jgi:hypothetical protein
MKITKIIKTIVLRNSKRFSNLTLPIKEVDLCTSLPENLQFILIGIMLGDGYLYRSSSTSNSRFEMSVGSNYKQFAESIGKFFSDYINKPVKALEIKGKNKIYLNFRLKTNTFPIFNRYHDMFYKLNTETGKYVKRIPQNILKNLNPVVLAYLIMTDGNFDKNRNRVRIYTNSYSKEDVEKLASAINKKL